MTFAASKFARFLPSATFAMAAEYLMGLSDSVICGQILGEEGLSVINLMQPVFNAVSFVALLVGTGTSVLYATEMGRFDRRRASELLTQGLWTALLLGLGLVAALGFARHGATAAFGVTGGVLDGARTYWAWFLPCALLEPLAFYLSSLCYADGDGRLSAFAYGAQLVGNCALSVPLTMKFGYAGCAVGTTIGHIAAVAVLLLHLRRAENSLAFVRHFSLADSGRICVCALGDASIRLCQAVLTLLLNLYVIARFGEGRLPVLAAALAVLGLSEAFDGVATAAQPLASVYIGESNDRLTRRIMRLAARVATAEGIALTLLLAVWPGLVTGLVGLSDPALVGPAQLAVRLVALGLVGTAFVMLLNSYYTFRVREGLAVGLTALATLILPAALFPAAGHLFGETGVWAALAASPYAALALVAAYVTAKGGRGAFPLLLDRAHERASRVYDLVLEPADVCRVSAALGKFLAVRRGLDARKAGLTSLLIEEALMLIRERNAGRRIHAELTVTWEKGVTIVVRDDGRLFDLTDADTAVSSLRAYLVSNLMVAIPARRNMTTTGFNRNVFKI